MATVVLIGTLDTKGREYRYLQEHLLTAGVEVVLVDIGVLKDPAIEPDISAADVATAAGTTIETLRFSREGSDTRAKALATMERGATTIVKKLRDEGRCDAVLGAAGSGGASVISGVMRAMPLGMPKLLLTTMVTNAAAYIGTRDITLMHSVTDIAGLNRFSRRILGNAALAAAGMTVWRGEGEDAGRPLVGITMFGVTTPGVLRLQDRLHDAGFETIVFHAVGSGGRAMEQMIDEGLVDGVVDFTTSELTDEFLGGVFSAGPDRMSAAGRQSIPQVVVPGAIEVLNFGPRDTVPAEFNGPDRRLIVHNPYVSAVRTKKEEAIELARIMTGKLNQAKGPTVVALPLSGFDSYQKRPDGPYIDDDADDAFCAEIRRTLRSDIPCIEEEFNINDPAFADRVAEAFIGIWRGHESAGGDNDDA
ncbi:MAG: UPF0261 family protein [Alphaproteobacteria bacterium]|nr:UPF0261 family protein [Alphaproteobacteria bacterium]